MDPNTMINLYNLGFRISLGVMIVAILTAVFIFFRLDVLRSYSILSGRAMKKSVAKAGEGDKAQKEGVRHAAYDVESTREVSRHSGKTGRFRLPGSGGKAASSPGGAGKASARARHQHVPAPAQRPDSTGRTESLGGNSAMQEWPETTRLHLSGHGTGAGTGQSNGLDTAAMAPAGTSGFRFDIKERTLIVHTDERV